MQNKLSVHCQGNSYPVWLHDSMARLAGRVKWIWLMDPKPVKGKRPFPDQRLGVRWWIGGDEREWNEFVRYGAKGAQRYYEILKPKMGGFPWAEVTQGPNEPPMRYLWQRQALNDFYVELAFLFHRDGRKLGGPVCGVGWPGGEANGIGMDWIEGVKRDTQDMAPLFSVVDYAISHNYGKRQGIEWTEWLGWTLRFQYMIEVLGESAPPWLISEGGLDICGDPVRSGWRAPGGPSEEQYLYHLVTVNETLQAWPGVETYCLFGAVPLHWPSFHIYERFWQRVETYILSLVDDEPVPPLPSDETATDAITLTEKVCWFCEHAKRQRAAENFDYLFDIVDELPYLAAHARDATRYEITKLR